MSEAVSNANWRNEIIGSEADEMLMVEAWKKHGTYQRPEPCRSKRLNVATHIGWILPKSIEFEVKDIEVSRALATV